MTGPTGGARRPRGSPPSPEQTPRMSKDPRRTVTESSCLRKAVFQRDGRSGAHYSGESIGRCGPRTKTRAPVRTRERSPPEMSLVDPRYPPKFRRGHAASKSIPRGAKPELVCQADTTTAGFICPPNAPTIGASIARQGRHRTPGSGRVLAPPSGRGRPPWRWQPFRRDARERVSAGVVVVHRGRLPRVLLGAPASIA